MEYKIDGHDVMQILLPASDDTDPHPRLLFNGYGVHTGEQFAAWLPDGWHDISLEVKWAAEGPQCWFISTPGLNEVCPIGLWCRCK